MVGFGETGTATYAVNLSNGQDMTVTQTYAAGGVSKATLVSLARYDGAF